MSTNLQNLLRDSLLNNTYDYSVLHDTLKNTWTNSYSYLYQLQKSYIEYEEHTYISNDIVSREVNNIGHLYVNKSFEACFDIDYDFIHVTNREEFKRSKFYTKKFTFNDMVDNPQIFHKLPIILIDNKCIWDYELYANHNSFTITLPFDRGFVVSKERNKLTDNIIYLDHKIQVFIVDNIMYDRITLNRSHILNTTNKTVTIDTSWLNKKTNKEGIYFISIHMPNNIGENYELGTILMPCIKNGNNITCKLSPDDYSKISKHSKNLYVSVIFIDKLHLHTFYTSNSYTVCEDNECNLFILQRDESIPYAMPIPVENLMVLRERDGVLTYVNNTDAVELFYPNIYRIKDDERKDGDIYYIYYFYHYAQSLKYTPMYDFYYDFLKIHFNINELERIIDDIYRGKIDYSEYSETQTNDFKEVFNKILNAGYYNHRYGEIDFVKRYLLEDENTGKDPIEYKDEIMRDWIAEDPNVLRDYIIEQNKLYTPVYHLWTKNVDLKSRLRTTTEPEMGKQDSFELPDECYVFSFRNDNTTSGKLLDIRVFVDGLFVVKMTQVRHYFTDYLYISKSLITNDSYIEVEVFPSYQYAEILNFNSLDDEKEISLLQPSDGIYPTAQDVYYITPSGHMMESVSNSRTVITPSTGGNTISIKNKEAASLVVNGIVYEETQIHDPALFQLTAIHNNTDYTIETTDPERPVLYTRLSKFKVKPLSDRILNNDIAFCISKSPNGFEIEVKQDIYPYISLAGINFNYNLNYIRIFKNGRLVPKNKYVFIDTFSFPRIVFVDAVEKGDIIYIDVTPYQYKEIYYQEEIPEGNNVIIDLSNYLDKPFDVRYYDVFLNGRKLSLNNVISITPHKIYLVNIKSIYNLQIFEKERDYEYFGTEFKNTKYFYTIDDLINSSFINDEEKQLLIDKIVNDSKDENLNIVPNENTEEKIDFEDVGKQYVYMYIFYNHYLLPKSFLNPDQLQFNKYEINTSYPLIQEVYYVKPSNSYRNEEEYTRRQQYDDVLMLDPDVYIEGKNNTDNSQIVYALGHLDQVDESIFDSNDTE